MFDYSKVIYLNNSTDIDILCKKHNHLFKQTPKSHLLGIVGCNFCSREAQKSNHKIKSFNSFVEQAEKVYGNYYNYVFDTYIYRLNIDVICPLHGNFSITQRKFLKTQGCSICHPRKYPDTIKYTKTNYITLCKNSGSYLYLLEFNNENELFYKIGITKNPEKRFKFFIKNYEIKILSLFYLKDPSIIWDLEKQFHNLFKQIKYKPNISFYGMTECFSLLPKDIGIYFETIKGYNNV